MTVRSRAGEGSSLPNPLTVEQVVAAVMRVIEAEGPIDGVAITGGEPLLQADFLAHVLSDSPIPHPRLLETSGTLPERLRMILPLIDIVSMDIKLPSNSGERPLWDEHEQVLRLAADKVYVKVLVDNGTDRREVARAAQLVRVAAPQASIFLQPISREDGGVDIDQPSLDRFFDEIRCYIADVRVVPQVHKLLRIP
jgi:organic radical activating enzyme